jgi:hypothetical protein
MKEGRVTRIHFSSHIVKKHSSLFVSQQRRSRLLLRPAVSTSR